MWTYDLWDIITGDHLTSFDAAPGCSWERQISEVPTGRHNIVIRRNVGPSDFPQPTKAQWDVWTFPNATIVSQSWNGVVRYAGRVESTTYDFPTGILEVTSTDIRWLWMNRLPFRIGDFYNEDGKAGELELTNLSLESVIAAAIKSGTHEDDPEDWLNLRIVFPASTPGGESLLVENWKWMTIDDIVREFEGRADGPDIDIEPRVNGGILEFVLRVGHPRLESPTYDFPMNVDKPDLFDVSVTRDGRDVATGVFALGDGTEEDKKFGQGGDVLGSRIAFIDKVVSVQDVADPSNVALLNSHAQGKVVVDREPKEEWKLSILASTYPSANGFRLGAVLRLEFRGDDWMPDGFKPMYLVGMRGDETEKITLMVQPLENL